MMRKMWTGVDRHGREERYGRFQDTIPPLGKMCWTHGGSQFVFPNVNNSGDHMVIESSQPAEPSEVEGDVRQHPAEVLQGELA
jgi:hypothetical protein